MTPYLVAIIITVIACLLGVLIYRRVCGIMDTEYNEMFDLATKDNPRRIDEEE